MATEQLASKVNWRDWDEQAFQAAGSEAKPVLLALTATWCHWCHVMDRTTYSDPDVIELVNRSFIPVKVDVDQRPELSARYNQGGFPSLALLDADGQVIAGRVYTPPAEMLKLLDEVTHSYSEGTTFAPEASEDPAVGSTRDQAAAAGLVLERLEGLYDGGFGGFGDEPKQPPWEDVEFLLSVYQRTGDRRLRDMACRTLDGLAAGLFDHWDGGFFRYSVSRDWRVPHYEKMLQTNARLVSTFLTAFQTTGKPAYKSAALNTLDYLLTILREPTSGLFYASQDADEDYYRLPWKNRDNAAKPSIDKTLYTGWNTLAAAAFLHAFGVTGKRSYLDHAVQILDSLWADFERAGRVLPHVFKAAGGPRFLADHVQVLGAFLACYQATGNRNELDRAEPVLDAIKKDFSAADGGFYDVSSEPASGGPPLVGVKPVLENALLVEAMVTLATINQDEQYLDLAKATLDTFSEVVPGRSYLGPANIRRVEEDEERLFLPAASAWARASESMRSKPVHVVVIGDRSLNGTKAMVRAALKAKTPSWVVQVLDPNVESEMVEKLGFPAREGATAYLCVGKQCLAPIYEPGELRRWARPGTLASLAGATLDFTS